MGLDVTFTLDAARDFDLDFSFTANELGHGFADVRLSRVGGATIFEDDHPDFERDDFGGGGIVGRGAGAGTLEPGQYRFLVDFSTGGAIGADNLDYSISLALTPADAGPGPRPPAPGGMARARHRRRARRSQSPPPSSLGEAPGLFLSGGGRSSHRGVPRHPVPRCEAEVIGFKN